MRILHVLAPAEVGGLETVVVELATAQVQRSHEVDVAAVYHRPEAGPHPFLRACRRDPRIHVHALQVSARRYWTERRRVRDLIRRLHPDIVHTHGYRCDVVHGLHRRSLRPFVSTLHGFTYGPRRKALYHWLQLRTLRSFDAVVAVSGEIKRTAIQANIPSERLYVIPNTMNPSTPLTPEAARAVLGLKASDFNIGWVGRLTSEKGIDVMVRAAALLADGAWVLSVVGSGPEQGNAEKLAGSLGIGGRCQWHGMVENAGRLIAAFDVFALSSRTEGTPMVLLEAMAAGVPIVATAVGGVPDLLDDSSALLVPPESPHALTRALVKTWHQPGEARDRAARARSRFMTEHGLAEWLAKYEEVYRNAIDCLQMRM